MKVVGQYANERCEFNDNKNLLASKDARILDVCEKAISIYDPHHPKAFQRDGRNTIT